MKSNSSGSAIGSFSNDDRMSATNSAMVDRKGSATGGNTTAFTSRMEWMSRPGRMSATHSNRPIGISNALSRAAARPVPAGTRNDSRPAWRV